jgi:sulfate adenylyltransferase subunit 1
VQYVIRPRAAELHDYRGYAGKVISGIYKKGDRVIVLPSGIESTIKAIEIGGAEIEEAYALQSVVLHLADDVDVSRGDMIVPLNNQPALEQEFEALLCWMDNKPLIPGNKYLLQINSRVVRSVVKEIEYKLDVNTLQKNYSPEKAQLNDIIKATIKTASPVAFDSYRKLRQGGGAILIDETSCVTVGACMLQ